MRMLGSNIFWFIIGVITLVLGVVGFFLPLIPTTPFLIVSAFAFGRSSPKIYDWLINHPKLGPPILDWQEQGAISVPAKIITIVMIVVSPIIAIAMGVPNEIIYVQAAILLVVAVFVLTRPNPKPRDELAQTAEKAGDETDLKK